MANARGWNTRQGYRGPDASAPIERRLAFWTADLEYSREILKDGEEKQDLRLIRMGKRYIKEATAQIANLQK